MGGALWLCGGGEGERGKGGRSVYGGRGNRWGVPPLVSLALRPPVAGVPLFLKHIGRLPTNREV